MDKLKHIRQDYNKFALSESDLTDDPMDLFELWMNIALDSDEEEPTAIHQLFQSKRNRHGRQP
jgi:pyridoxamine 5'-phosphate oxidase